MAAYQTPSPNNQRNGCLIFTALLIVGGVLRVIDQSWLLTVIVGAVAAVAGLVAAGLCTGWQRNSRGERPWLLGGPILGVTLAGVGYATASLFL